MNRRPQIEERIERMESLLSRFAEEMRRDMFLFQQNLQQQLKELAQELNIRNQTVPTENPLLPWKFDGKPTDLFAEASLKEVFSDEADFSPLPKLRQTTHNYIENPKKEGSAEKENSFCHMSASSQRNLANIPDSRNGHRQTAGGMSDSQKLGEKDEVTPDHPTIEEWADDEEKIITMQKNMRIEIPGKQFYQDGHILDSGIDVRLENLWIPCDVTINQNKFAGEMRKEDLLEILPNQIVGKMILGSYYFQTVESYEIMVGLVFDPGCLSRILISMFHCDIIASLCGGRVSEGIFVGAFPSVSSSVLVYEVLLEKKRASNALSLTVPHVGKINENEVIGIGGYYNSVEHVVEGKLYSLIVAESEAKRVCEEKGLKVIEKGNVDTEFMKAFENAAILSSGVKISGSLSLFGSEARSKLKKCAILDVQMRILKNHLPEVAWLGSSWTCLGRRRHYQTFYCNGVIAFAPDFIYVLAEKIKRRVIHIGYMYGDVVVSCRFHKTEEVGYVLIGHYDDKENSSSLHLHYISSECMDRIVTIPIPEPYETLSAKATGMDLMPFVCYGQFDNSVVKPFEVTIIQGCWKQVRKGALLIKVVDNMKSRGSITWGPIPIMRIQKSKNYGPKLKFANGRGNVGVQFCCDCWIDSELAVSVTEFEVLRRFAMFSEYVSFPKVVLVERQVKEKEAERDATEYYPTPASCDALDVPLVDRWVYMSKEDMSEVILNGDGQPVGWPFKANYLADGWIYQICEMNLPSNILRLARNTYMPVDVIVASDCLFEKNGHGIVSEAMVDQIPFVFIHRDYFNEEPLLRSMLEFYLISVDMEAIKNGIRQILQGLNFLHTHNPPVIHRDLKCNTISVNENQGEVKMGNLWLATMMQQHTFRSVVEMPEFMAPEFYEEEYTELMDIYSVGMCIFELVIGDYRYSECKNQTLIYKKLISCVKPTTLEKVKDPVVRQSIDTWLPTASQRICDAPQMSKTAAKLANSEEYNFHFVDLNSSYKMQPSSIYERSMSGTSISTLALQRSNKRNGFSLKGGNLMIIQSI